MTFYVIDTTLNPHQEKRFSSYNSIVEYLGTMSSRAYGQNKAQRKIVLEELGYGEDDKYSTLFVRSMEEKFNVGVVRNDVRVRCDIANIIAFQKPEYGN